MEIGATKRRHEVGHSRDGNLFGLHYRLAMEAAQELTPAKRLELAALRKLAKACTKVRDAQRQPDEPGEAIDVDARLIKHSDHHQ
jgi:hypothetical protein